jgi:hypothetical protein
MLSTRRALAAGVGAYVGITVAALGVGIELGIEPALFSSNGHALYSPYGLSEAVPAMLAAHAFGASIVEGLITGLGVAYLQRRHPEYLTSLRGIYGSDVDAAARPAQRPLWQVVLATVVAAVVVLGVIGLVEGGGNPNRMFNADWSHVDWPSVGSMLLITAVAGLVLVPAAYMLLPRAVKRIGAAFVALAVVAPIGLIAPGFAYGEGSTADVKAAFGYVPGGLRDLSGVFAAPMSGYNLPLPFFDGANAPLWHAGIGYEIAGIVGIMAVGGVTYLVARLLRRGDGQPHAAAEAGS